MRTWFPVSHVRRGSLVRPMGPADSNGRMGPIRNRGGRRRCGRGAGAFDARMMACEFTLEFTFLLIGRRPPHKSSPGRLTRPASSGSVLDCPKSFPKVVSYQGISVFKAGRA